jgi:hypothetical protein
MGKASSSKKIARAARAGGRASGVRERNLLFPSAIGIILLLGCIMVGVAWNDHRSAAASVAPVANVDHWHAAYGFYVCGKWLPAIPTYENPDGIHTHGDGVIHIHPYSAAASGVNARLKVFLDSAGVKLTDTELKINGKTYKEGKDKCNGKSAELVMARWEHVQSTKKEPALIHNDFGDTRFRDNGEGFTIAFMPSGDTDIPKPESAATLAELGAADAGTATSTTTPGETTTPAAGATTTAPGSSTTSTPAGSTTTAGGSG